MARQHKRRREKRSEQNSDHKGEKHSHHDKRKVLMYDLWANIAFQVVSLFVFAICLGFFFYYLNKGQQIVATWLGFATWVCMGLAAALFAHSWFLSHQSAPAFLLEPEASVIMDTKGVTGNRFWVSYRSGYGDTASPVDVFMFLRIVNLQSVQTQVLKLAVEAKLGDRPWLKLVHIPQVGTQAYFGGDLTHIRRVDLSRTGLDYLLQQRLLQPHEPVRGWAFFEVPGDYSAPNGMTIQYRISITDTAGTSFVYTTAAETLGSKSMLPGGSDAAQPKYLEIREWANISASRIKNYSDPVR